MLYIAYPKYSPPSGPDTSQAEYYEGQCEEAKARNWTPLSGEEKTAAHNGYAKEQKQPFTAFNPPDFCDMAAQYRAAAAAEASGHEAALTTFLTFIGVVAVVFTLWCSVLAVGEARRVTRVTREIGQKQVRAYISIVLSEPNISLCALDENTIWVRVKITLMNHGLSPAFELTSGITFYFENEICRSGEKPLELPDGLPPSGVDSCYMVEKIKIERWPNCFSSLQSFSASVRLSHKDVFGEIIETESFFVLEHGNGMARLVLANPDAETLADRAKTLNWRRYDRKRYEDRHAEAVEFK